ncbi:MULTISPECIES: YlbG family protein [Bacillaceae]|uniref:YlbG family protein n=1 Tax=Bacillaceae TaxID=186817 RepID=UPI00047B564C|nr:MULTISPECIES: YlbG family protein [Bacillaceae]UOE92953.1 YlbG family protein [Alkalihalobacillus sp. LMS39]
MVVSERQGIAVWLHSLKYARQLRKYGNVHYVSKKMKYVILYCDQNKVSTTVEKLESFHFVKSVNVSMRPFIKTEYQNAKPDKAKEYDYRMGL